MKIAIDIDKTFFNCDSFIYELLNRLLPDQNTNKKLKYKDIDIKDEKIKESIFKNISKIHNVNFYKIDLNAKKVINKLYNSGNEIILLSSRPANRALSNILVKCLKDYDVLFTKLVVACNNKPVYCVINDIDMVIDNNYFICSKCSEAGINAIWIKEESNKQDKKKKGNKFLKTVNTWKEIEELLKTPAR